MIAKPATFLIYNDATLHIATICNFFMQTLKLFLGKALKLICNAAIRSCITAYHHLQSFIHKKINDIFYSAHSQGYLKPYRFWDFWERAGGKICLRVAQIFLCQRQLYFWSTPTLLSDIEMSLSDFGGVETVFLRIVYGLLQASQGPLSPFRFFFFL